MSYFQQYPADSFPGTVVAILFVDVVVVASAVAVVVGKRLRALIWPPLWLWSL